MIEPGNSFFENGISPPPNSGEIRLPVLLAVEVEEVEARLPAEVVAGLGGQDGTLERRPVERERGVVGVVPLEPVAQRVEAEDFRRGEVVDLQPGPRLFQRRTNVSASAAV